MSETPTPRMDAACDNLDDCLDWEQIAYRVAAEGQKLERELTAERAARERAEAERDALAEALRRAHALCEEALPKFNWGASALDATAIALLNDVPLEVARALAALERGDGKERS